MMALFDTGGWLIRQVPEPGARGRFVNSIREARSCWRIMIPAHVEASIYFYCFHSAAMCASKSHTVNLAELDRAKAAYWYPKVYTFGVHTATHKKHLLPFVMSAACN